MTTPGADARERPDAGPRVGRAARQTSAPARPALEGERFTAAVDPGRRPRALTASAVLWLLAALAHLAAAVVLWAGQDAVRATISAAVLERDPATAADVVGDAARWAFLAGAGGPALVGVVLALSALGLRRGHGWSRPVLGLTGIAAVAVAVVVQDLVRVPARGLLDDPGRLAVLAPLPLVVAATIAMLLPAAGAWLRRVQARAR